MIVAPASRARSRRSGSRLGWFRNNRRQGLTASTPSLDRKSTRLNSSHSQISYAVFCLKKKKKNNNEIEAMVERKLATSRFHLVGLLSLASAYHTEITDFTTRLYVRLHVTQPLVSLPR